MSLLCREKILKLYDESYLSFLGGVKTCEGLFVCKKSLLGRLVVTTQIREFGNLGCIPETGCLRDPEEVNGLAMSWPLGWAKPMCLCFEGEDGVFCWVLLLWILSSGSVFPIFHWEAAWLPLPFLQPDAWRAPRTGCPLSPPLHVPAGKQEHTKMQHKRHWSVSDAGSGGAWDVAECFFSPDSTTFRPFSVWALGMLGRWVRRVQCSRHVRLWAPA